MHKNNVIFLLLLITSLTLSIGKQKEDNINIFGTFEHRDGQKIKVEKISFNDDDETGRLYRLPNKTSKFKKEKRIGSHGIERTSIYLNENPADNDFYYESERFIGITEIMIPHPHTDWIYKKNQKHKGIKYTEIIIKKNGKGLHCLIPKNTKVRGIGIDDGRKINTTKITPFKKIIIDGYKNEINKKSDGQNK